MHEGIDPRQLGGQDVDGRWRGFLDRSLGRRGRIHGRGGSSRGHDGRIEAHRAHTHTLSLSLLFFSLGLEGAPVGAGEEEKKSR